MKIYRAGGAHPNSASAHVLIGALTVHHRYRSLSHNTVFPSQRFKDHDPGGESLHCRCQGGTNALVPGHPRSSSFALWPRSTSVVSMTPSAFAARELKSIASKQYSIEAKPFAQSRGYPTSPSCSRVDIELTGFRECCVLLEDLAGSLLRRF